MKDITHFVFSRVNCNYPIDPHYPQHMYDRIAEKQFNREWLEQRLDFMEQFTVPSLNAQTNQNFIWVILLHPDTPVDLTARFNSLKDVMRKVRKVKVIQTELSPRQFLPVFLKKCVSTSWVATTTLDTDDAISNEYIEVLQENFRAKNEYLNVTRGFMYVPRLGRFFGRKSNHNPFITLVEPTDEPRGVYCVVHGAAHTVAPVEQIVHPGAFWVQVVHGDNLVNKAGMKKKDKGREYDQLRPSLTVGL